MFKNPFSFNGRIRRLEFIITFIVFQLVYSVTKGLFFREGISSPSTLQMVPLFIVFWLFFSQGAKREHDLGNSGWWQLIPLRFVWLLLVNGNKGANKYGEDPKDKIK